MPIDDYKEHMTEEWREIGVRRVGQENIGKKIGIRQIMEDYIVRATAAGGQMRAFAATTENLVESARVHHNTSPVATAALGRILTAGQSWEV